MSRISIDVTSDEHKKLKTLAALNGKSIKEYVLERTLGESEEEALRELEQMLDERIRRTRVGPVSRKSASEIFNEVARRKAR